VTFEHKDKKDPSKSHGQCTMMKYFDVHYKIKLRDHKQPLLYVNSRKGEGNRIYLPTELCNEASLPPDFTRDQYKMRQIQDYKISGPNKRMEKINKLITKFQNDPTF
jgi:hypothetical protein